MVHTGNVFGAGTDANVYIVLVGEIDETGYHYALSSYYDVN